MPSHLNTDQLPATALIFSLFLALFPLLPSHLQGAAVPKRASGKSASKFASAPRRSTNGASTKSSKTRAPLQVEADDDDEDDPMSEVRSAGQLAGATRG